jgi:hypothetical protein
MRLLMRNHKVMLSFLAFLADMTFRTVIKSILPSATVVFTIAEIWVVVFAGRSEEEFVAALKDENDGNAHSEVGQCRFLS